MEGLAARIEDLARKWAQAEAEQEQGRVTFGDLKKAIAYAEGMAEKGSTC